MGFQEQHVFEVMAGLTDTHVLVYMAPPPVVSLLEGSGFPWDRGSVRTPKTSRLAKHILFVGLQIGYPPSAGNVLV